MVIGSNYDLCRLLITADDDLKIIYDLAPGLAL